jgi:hypothetical protein
MSALELKTIAFTALETELFEQRPTIDESFRWLSGVIGNQVEQVLAPLRKNERNQIARHFLCSTMIELPFTTGDIRWEQVVEMLSAQGEHNPDTFINAYECASWGYSLRHYLQQQPDAKYLLVSIVDANLYDLQFWRYNENWHDSGFGVTTVLLEVTQPMDNELICGCAITHNSMAEFATVVRRTATGRENCQLALPFFPEHIQQMFDRLLANQPRLPDLHENWGHCFGADPWLSILSHCQNNPVEQAQNFLACSLALNGYYTMAEVTVTPNTRFLLSGSLRYEQA